MKFQKVSTELPKVGQYYPVVIGLYFVGTHERSFWKDGVEIHLDPERRVVVMCELHKRKGPALMKDGRPFVSSYDFSENISPKSDLGRLFVCACGPRWQDDQPGDEVDPSVLLGRYFKTDLKEGISKRTREPYVVMDKPRALDPEEDEGVHPKPINPLIFFSIDEHDIDDPKFAKAPDWIKKKVKMASEKAHFDPSEFETNEEDEDEVLAP
jgi:hypothetical protein